MSLVRVKKFSKHNQRIIRYNWRVAKNFELNSDQKRAVAHKEGPIIVVAGAGTGKTRVITERIKYLIQEKRIDSDSILALTFTEKAANEMLERIGDIMPLGYKEPWVSTFHSFADRILKKEGLEIGLDIGYQILSYPKQWLLVRKNLFDFNLGYYRPLGNPTRFISAILKFISRLQDEGIDEVEFAKFVQNFSSEVEEKRKWLELASFYKKYQELKLKYSYLDFGDLILWCLKLFSSRPNILKKYQNQFLHLMVDEFQDTNFAQYQLVKLLFPLRESARRSLMVTGDDSQSCYKFRGAAVSNILEFKDDYKNCEIVTLISNYRSLQNILDPAYTLIQNNNPDTLESKLGISKKLVSSNKKSKVVPQVYEFARLDEEVNFVVTKIEELLAQDPQMSYKDVAILARANNHLDPFVLALRAKEIPYQLIGNRGLYDKDEVKNVLAFLRVLVNPTDGVSLYRVLNNPVFAILPTDTAKILSDSKFKKIDFWECVKSSTNASIKNLVEMIGGFQKELLKYAPSGFVFKLINTTGILDAYTKNETTENLLAIKNINLFLDQVKNFESDYFRDRRTTPTILDYIEYLDLMIEAGDNPAQAEIEDIDTVNLSTIHSAKGLEYEAVFMVNLVSGRFPSRERGDLIEIPSELIKETLPTEDEHLQEERRLFYVAMTRAKKHLFLTYANNYGGKRDTAVSGFISETGLKVSQKVAQEQTKETQTMFGVKSQYRKQQNVGGVFRLDYVNYTQISAYQICPLKYKYAHVIKIPTQPSFALTFGNSIHSTLREFHTEDIFNGNVSCERLLELYKKNWDGTGYLDPKQREQRFASGEKFLKEYYQKEKGGSKKIIELEKTINLKLAGVKFTGRVDRIDRIDGNKVEIIDYKTGKLKEQKDVDKDLQTSLYAWGVRENFNYEPEILTLYFVEEVTKVSSHKTLEQIKEQVAKTEEVVEIMKKGDFTATPGFHCDWCDYKDLCPFAQKSL